MILSEFVEEEGLLVLNLLFDISRSLAATLTNIIN